MLELLADKVAEVDPLVIDAVWVVIGIVAKDIALVLVELLPYQ